MFGKARLYIPGSGNIQSSRYDGLSDELALATGRTAAYTLSEHDGPVVVTLSDGTDKVIGYDSVSGNLRIGTLTRPWRRDR